MQREDRKAVKPFRYGLPHALWPGAWLAGVLLFHSVAPGSLSAQSPSPPASRLPLQLVLEPLSESNSSPLESWGRFRATPAQWTVEYQEHDAEFGYSIGRAGDLDKDGFDDLIISSRLADTTDKDVGLIFVFPGSRSGINPARKIILSQPQYRSGFGYSVSGAGDVNGDGFPDIIVGANRWKQNTAFEGRAFVFNGGPDLVRKKPSWDATSLLSNSQFAYAVDTAGDVNGDGYADVVVGAYRFTKNVPVEGAVLVYHGSDNGLNRFKDWRVLGGQGHCEFGASVAGVGDVNGDGYDDVLVGAPSYDTPLPNAGRVFLYYGTVFGLETEPGWVFDGDVPFGRLGTSVARADDINGDGYADFVIGSPGEEKASDWPGSAMVFFGSPDGPAERPDWIVRGNQIASRFGSTVAAAGDVNGDGFPDLLVSAKLHSSLHREEGRVYLYLGDGRTLEREAVWIAEGGQTYARFGWTARGVGDLNGDGFADFAVASAYYDTTDKDAGRVDVFYGSKDFRWIAASAVADGAQAPVGPAALPPVDTPSQTGWWLAAAGLALALGCVVWMLRRYHAKAAPGMTGHSTEQALTLERERIARELHDDLGAHLTRISLLSSQVKGADANPGQPSAEALAHAARETIAAMDQIVWSVNPANATLENLALFIGQFAEKFFAGSGIACRQQIPPDLPDRKLPPDLRKNVFLTVKEALNNVLKHSRATEVWTRVAHGEGRLRITITDNGAGLPPEETRRRGNGLKNMKKRMEEIGGKFSMGAGPDGGAAINLTVPI